MRQLIARIDDDLHARLKRLAESEGRTLNALVVEALEAAVGRADGRRSATRRAALAGQLARDDVKRLPPSRVELDALVESTRGLGPMIDELLDDDRGPRT